MINPLGTYVYTWINGQYVGEDSFGNRYYEHKKNSTRPLNKQKRWVLYKGLLEASKISSQWHGWMHFSFDAPLDLSKQYSWQKPHTPNMTGTKYAYRYHSSIDKVSRRVLHNYESWKPE